MDHLIDRVQNFTLDRKLLSIDTDDRDITKYPNPSEFEISCPQIYTNIESFRIIYIRMPNRQFNISEYLQNNKFNLEVLTTNTTHVITLDDGFYTSANLETALNNALNAAESGFVVKYNEVTNKMFFGHSSFSFSLNFNQENTYNNCYNFNCDNINYNKYVTNSAFLQEGRWGLGYYLGYHKKKYTSKAGSNIFNYSTTTWITNPSNIIEPDKTLDLDVIQNLYIEIDKFNQNDEIKPYTIDKYTNSNSGIVNSYIAKIPMTKCGYHDSFLFKEDFLTGYSYFQPPLEKISRLKFRIRYHNGMLADLQNNNISFTLEINQIRNEIKDYKVRTRVKA